MEHEIDLAAWNRREIYDFFSGMQDPMYMVTFTVDVTGLHRYVKERGLSFYYAMIYLCTQAADEVENFRYTVREGKVYLLDGRSPSFTDMKPGSELFHIVTMPCEGTLEDFCRAAGERSRAQDCFIRSELESDGLIFYSCLPWVRLTALSNERDPNPDDATPRISWGKFTERDGRRELGLSVEVNHRFVDGIHIGQFSAALERKIAAIGAVTHRQPG
ncbi:MAG: chloramphenicol acetyltransferase [Clostridiales bacterium]|nr:chloramphenicol acetyltransferase [Clostridiales bacterium]